MFKQFRIAALSALVGLGTLAGAASADSLYLSTGQNGPRIGVQLGDNGHSYHRYDPRHNDRHDDWRHPRRVSACTTGQALAKARGLGLYNARVQSVGSRSISVVGFKHRHPDRVVFARAPYCPVIG